MRFLRRLYAAAKWVVLNKLEAAQYSISRSLRHTPAQDARFDVRQAERNVVTGKARDFEANNWLAQRLGSTFVDYTVGANGLQVMPASSDPEWNKRNKVNFNQFAERPDLCSRQNLGILQGQIAWRWFFDGEMLILKTRGQSKNGKTQPRIQLIESHRVGTPPSLSKEEGRTIIDGVKIDGNGRPVGYYIKDSSDSNTYRLVDAEDIIHVFEPTRPGEYRGTSFLAPVINQLHDLDDLQKLEMQAAKRNASDAVIIETATGEADAEELLRNDGNTTASADGKVRKQHYEDIFGATARYIYSGDKVHQNPGERPSATTIEHWQLVISQICIGAGIPKQLVFPYSIQGTIGRYDIDAAAVTFRARSGVIAQALREIYIYVTQWGIKTEKEIADPPFDWVNASIRPPRSPNADIGRNSAAAIANLENGLTNYDIEFGALGLDWREEFVKLKEQQDFAKSIGLVMPAQAMAQAEAEKKKEEPVTA